MSKIPNSKYNNLVVKFVPDKRTAKHYKHKTFNYGGKVRKWGDRNGVNIEVYDKVKPYITSSRVALDIGARWGEWTRMLQHDFQQVFCFEPLSKRNALINENCITDNIVLYNCCLGEKDESVDMHGGCIFDKTLKGMEKKASHVDKISVQKSIRLDALGITAVDFIKIDVEGFELPVIKGGLKTIKKWKPVICLEQNGSEKKWRGAVKNEAMEFLISLGMKVEKQLSDQDFLMVWKTDEELALEKEQEEYTIKQEELVNKENNLKLKEEELAQREKELLLKLEQLNKDGDKDEN